MIAGAAGFALVSYLERTNISIAAELMIPALGITKIQMGEIFTSFLLGYAVFQVPGGIAGDKLGPRVTLGLSAVVWAGMTALTGWVPELLRGRPHAAFWALAAIRFVLGAAEATTFPVANRVVRNWVAPPGRALANAVVFLGTSLASATAGPLVSVLMLRIGWERAFEVCALPALALGVVWWALAQDYPGGSPQRTQKDCGAGEAGLRDAAPLWSLLRQRNVILLILSYVSEGYVLFIFVFWLYIYLVEQRGFTMMRGGWATSVPWLAALAISPLGGIACDRLSMRMGRLAGAKRVIMVGYAASGALLFLAAYAGARWVAVGALSLSVAALMSAESSFWVSAAHLSEERAGALSGVMNMAGIAGGIASTMLVPVLTEHFGWLAAFGSGAAMAVWCVVFAAGLREGRVV
jgi:ACS family glucarate transporter-like MFS transporter